MCLPAAVYRRGQAAIAYGFGSVWVANKLDSTVSRINPGTGAVTETIPVGNGPTALAVASTGVWVADAAGTVVRIDPATGRVASTLRVGEPALAAAIVKGVPWVGTGAGYSSRHRGGTIRVLSAAWPGTIDPATNYGPLPWQFGTATDDTLVTFQQADGSGGLQLVPDLALAHPRPAGRRHPVHLRAAPRRSPRSRRAGRIGWSTRHQTWRTCSPGMTGRCTSTRYAALPTSHSTSPCRRSTT